MMTSATVKTIAAGVVGSERSSITRVNGALVMSNARVSSSATTAHQDWPGPAPTTLTGMGGTLAGRRNQTRACG
jgi:hypothetical protein